MPTYSYKAIDSHGMSVQGMINAFNDRAAMERLDERGFKSIKLRDKTDSLQLKIMTLIMPVGVKDLVVFSRQFSVMISANLALVQALKICADQTENATLKAVIFELAYEVDGGSSLSAAMLKRPKVFTPFFTNVIRSGETSGRLDEVLAYLADEMEKDYDMSSKIRGAMIYPAFVLSMLFVVGIIMMVVIVPKLTNIMSETGAQLPASTKAIIAISDFLVHFWWTLAFIFGGIFIGMKSMLRTEKGRRLFDLAKLRLPVFGKLFQLIYIVRFTRSLSTLITGGVAIARSLDVIADIVGNQVFRDLIVESKKTVEEGGSLSKPFLTSDEIPKMVPQMIIVGEKTGKLDLVLKRITEFYSREIAAFLANVMTLMEPLIMIIMGVGVGLMVAAVLMPMYNMASQF
jgi:type IV pilus assembly protein PilC